MIKRNELIDKISKTIYGFDNPYSMPCVIALADTCLELGGQRELARHQPCGCIVCACENEDQCQGCGAKTCDEHLSGVIPNPVYVELGVQAQGVEEWWEKNATPKDAMGTSTRELAEAAFTAGHAQAIAGKEVK